MRRVVVTGLGIVSSIGNNADEVSASLKAGRSGITANAAMAEHGFRSQIAGAVDLDTAEHIDKRTLRFMGPGAAYAYIAMGQAIADAGWTRRTSSTRDRPHRGLGRAVHLGHAGRASDGAETGATKRIGPFAVPKCMSSTVSANLSTAYRIKGMNFSITSACSTSLHCIGMAAQQIMLGKQDVMFAGGGEELDWTLSCLFDAMGAMSSKFNDTPERASRAFDADRDGFVISGGGGMVVLEPSWNTPWRAARRSMPRSRASARPPTGPTWWPPRARAASGRCAAGAGTLPEGRKVSYINAHGTSTPVGDVGEIEAVRRVFGEGTRRPSVRPSR
jgi:3-oxoacyl-[acyl-carrier-protein] synthase-1